MVAAVGATGMRRLIRTATAAAKVKADVGVFDGFDPGDELALPAPFSQQSGEVWAAGTW